MSKHLIDFIDISKSYDNTLVLDELNLYIRENEFLTLLGPSGCGKTTTLRILGGFEKPDKGQVLFDGQDTHMSPFSLQFTYLSGLPSRMVYFSHFCLYFLPTAGESTKETPPEAEAPLDSPNLQRDGTAVTV